jgi:hypothetical protein
MDTCTNERLTLCSQAFSRMIAATYRAVYDGEADGHGQVDPGLQEGDNLSARAGGRDDQHILRMHPLSRQ